MNLENVFLKVQNFLVIIKQFYNLKLQEVQIKKQIKKKQILDYIKKINKQKLKIYL